MMSHDDAKEMPSQGKDVVSQDVTCRSESIIGKAVDKSIVLNNCR